MFPTSFLFFTFPKEIFESIDLMVRILIGLKTGKTTTKSVHYMKIYEKVRPKLQPKYVQTTTKEDRKSF